MVSRKRGHVWRSVRNSPGIQIVLYFIAFASLIGFYTYIFHEYYPLLEGRSLSWANSLLFVVESMTTVGYGDLLPFANDMTMLLAIQIMLSGIVMIFIVIPLLIAPFLTTLLAPTPPRGTSHTLSGHTVVVGHDELTMSVIDSLTISDHDILIIEPDKTRALEIATHYRKRAYVIWGEFSDPATWTAAHIGNAAFVVISEEERMTATIILGIREMTKAKIISVVDKLSFDRYLRFAGAEYILSPKHATGRILARHTVLNTTGDSVPELPLGDRIGFNHNGPGHELRLINVPVFPGSNATGKTLRELGLFERYGIHVLCLWQRGVFVSRPKPEEKIVENASLFLFGRTDAIIDAIREEFDADGRKEALCVIAGFGDVGKSAYSELVSAGMTCIVVDSMKQGVDQVVGNAEDERVLKEARIETAQFCIVALNDDDINIFTTLMARNLNPGLRILARANEPGSVDKLYRAGADYVALLPMIGGQAIGRIVLSNSLTILLELPDEERVVMKQVKDAYPRDVGWYAGKTGVRIIGIESASRSVVSPSADEILFEGDSVIAAGNTEQLKKFIHLL